MASFFPEKLFNFVQCVLCNLDVFSFSASPMQAYSPQGEAFGSFDLRFFHSSCRVQLSEAEPCACRADVVVPLCGTHFQPFGKDGNTRRFHFCGNEVGSNRRSLLPSSLHSG